MAVKTWVHITDSTGERWRYYDGLGRTTLGIKVTKLDKTIDPSVGDREYLLSTGGYLYTKPTMAKTAGGDTYICDSRSIIYKDKVVSYKGARYYVTSSGKLSTFKNGWKRLSCMKNRPYYFGSTPGKISEKTGWVKVTYPNGSYAWYLFTENGNAYINTWKGRYYFDENGVAARGMKTIDGKTYYFKPSTTTAHNGEVYKNSLITYKNNKYYAGSDGALYQRKWAKINGNYYYFQQNRTLLKNAYARKNGVYGYVDSTGKFTTGWVIVDASANKVRYLNPKAKGYLTNTYKVIDGVRYYFDKDGYRVSDLTSYYPSNWKNDPVLVKIHNGSYAPYYLECDKTNGVITIYTGSDKKIPIRTVRTSVGAASTPTPSGTYTLTRSLRWQPLMGPSWGQYGTHVVNGIYIHSVAGSEANSYSLPTYSYDILGTPASHGCLRVCVADAKWIYENCSGATIKIFNGTAKSLECDKGPLGRNPLVPRYGSGTFDPTDPNV
jgi:glucan-binding YG repeat protein